MPFCLPACTQRYKKQITNLEAFARNPDLAKQERDEHRERAVRTRIVARVTGVVSKPKLNGCYVEVQAIRDNGRYEVLVRGYGELAS